MTFKELEYLKMDLDYKSELISELEAEFLSSVNEYLKTHPNLKDQYEDVLAKEMEKAFDDQQIEVAKIQEEEKKEMEEAEAEEAEEEPENVEEPEVSTNLKDPLLKDLYRKIVKKTHPDKVQDKEKNDFYVEATDAYDVDDIFTIYLICNKLDIEYVIRLEDAELLNNQINVYGRDISVIESTFPWKWGESDDDMQDKLVESFIVQRIGQG